MITLDATEQRVLGALLEKQKTVPASYPLSLNALRTACNQTSSREPVMDLSDNAVDQAARELKTRGLLRFVWAGKGSRTVKYHQLLDEVLELADDERALLTVLLLRGSQAPGELRTRCERLHPFADRSDVEEALRRLAGRPEPLVRELERKPGQQDNRWVHLLGPAPAEAGPLPKPAVDRETVLAAGAAARDDRVRAAYDEVAEAWFAARGDELTEQPFDVWFLERVASLAGEHPVVDVGCGPGHITAFLADTGVSVTGIDLSPAMVEVARREFPDLDFEVTPMASLLRPRTAAGWGAVLAWHALVHLAGSELAPVVAELARTLVRGGVLAVALPVGHEVRTITEFEGHEVDVDLVLHDPDDVLAAVRASGLVDVEWYRRGPHPGEAHENLYVLARRSD